jgi:predicted small secreted protein
MRKFLMIAVIAATTLTAACNTVHGAGKDAASAGDAVAKAADKAK